MNKTYLLAGNELKSFDLEEYPEEAWTWLSGGPDANEQTQLLSRVDWLYRAIELVMISTSDIPFYLTGPRGREFDSSADWKNHVGFWADPMRTIQLIAGGLFTRGYAYLLREKGGGIADKRLRYLMPGSITPHIDGKTGLDYFERMMPDGTRKKFKPGDEIVYFWLPDSGVEIGPPQSYPAKAAFSAAGVLYNTDAFVAQYFGRGAVKATLLAIPPNTKPAESEKVKIWWKQFVSGIKNAFGSNVLSTDVKATIIGEGLESLSDKNLTDQARQAIATASGIPQSLLAANAANYATAGMDKRNLYDNKLIPWAKLIAQTFNDQVFSEMGYTLVFRPEEMEIYQEDENERATAVKTYVDAGMKLSVAAEMLGLDLPAGVTYADLDPEEKPIPLQLQPFVGETSPEIPMEANRKPQETPNGDNTNIMTLELDKWHRKALKALKAGKSAAVEFDSDVIPAATMQEIQVGLANCKTAEDIRRVFRQERDTDPLALIALELKRANDILLASTLESH